MSPSLYFLYFGQIVKNAFLGLGLGMKAFIPIPKLHAIDIPVDMLGSSDSDSMYDGMDDAGAAQTYNLW